MSRPDTRSSERTDLELSVKFTLNDMTYAGITRNVSRGGVFVATEQLARVGERLRLKAWLPGTDRRLVVETEVRWIRHKTGSFDAQSPAGMGLRFVNPSEDDVAALETFLARRDSLMREEG